MGERIGRDGRGRGPKGGNDECVNDLNSQGNDQGLGANGNVNGVNGNVEGVYRDVGGAPENIRDVLVNGNWDMSGCSIDQKVKYIASSFVGKALTWWNSQIYTLSQEVAISMSWNDFKFMMIEEFCPSHEMQKLETKLWNHVMVGAGHAAYTDRFHELDRLVPHLVTPKSRKIERYIALTDEAVRYGLIKKVDKRGNIGEPSKDKNDRDDNKRTRTRNVFATTVNPVGRENMGAWTKCTTYNFFYAPGGPCRTCFNYNRPSHLARDCRVVPENVNPVNLRNLTPARRACYECGSTDIQTSYFRIKLIPGAVPIAKSLYHLAPSELEELSGQLKELQKKNDILIYSKTQEEHLEHLRLVLELHRKEKLIRISNLDKLCNAPVLALLDGPEDFVIELFSDYDCEIRYHPGKANVVADALSRKERVKPKRVRAMDMTPQSSIKDRILAAQKEAEDESAGLQKGLDEMIEQRSDRTLYYLDRIWVSLKGDVRTLIMDDAHNSKYSVHPGADNMYYDLRDRYWWPGMKKDITIYAEVREGQLIGLELVQESTDKISQIKNRLKAAHDHQKSYADKRRKPLESSVGDYVLLKVSPWKGVVHFWKKEKLAPRFVGPFEIIEKIGPIAYMLDLPEELDGIQVYAKLNFIEEPVEILEIEFKKLKRSRIAIVKVRWNSKRGPEFTWEREDQMKLKYSHLFSDASS
ncbi:putative reverse transcriptase domain-containing protein [Tanacetum coccineum]